MFKRLFFFQWMFLYLQRKKHNTLSSDFWVASTHAVKICDHLNVNWLYIYIYIIYIYIYIYILYMCVCVCVCVCVPAISCPVGWGCRIQWLHLWREVRLPNECPGYNTKQSDGEVPVMLELWGIQINPSLLSLPGPLWPGVGAPDRLLSMDLIEINCILILNWITWNRIVLIFKLRTYAKLNYLK